MSWCIKVLLGLLRVMVLISFLEQIYIIYEFDDDL